MSDMADMVPHCYACRRRHYGDDCPKVRGDSRTPEPTSKLGADAPTSAIHSAGRPEPGKSAERFSDALRRWNRDCTGWEPSMSLLQRGADDAADLIDELCAAIDALQSRDFTFHEAQDKASAALAKARGETWKTCHIGSCHRHEECMYSPCRNASVDTHPEGQDPAEGLGS